MGYLDFLLEEIRQTSMTVYNDKFLEPKVFLHIHPFGFSGWHSGCSMDFRSCEDGAV